jgi:hypothetical protein
MQLLLLLSAPAIPADAAAAAADSAGVWSIPYVMNAALSSMPLRLQLALLLLLSVLPPLPLLLPLLPMLLLL